MGQKDISWVVIASGKSTTGGFEEVVQTFGRSPRLSPSTNSNSGINKGNLPRIGKLSSCLDLLLQNDTELLHVDVRRPVMFETATGLPFEASNNLIHPNTFTNRRAGKMFNSFYVGNT